MHFAPLALALAVLPGQVQEPVLITRPVFQPAPRGTPAAPQANDDQTLKAAHLANTDAALLDFFRKRTPHETDPAQVAELIKQLGDKTATVHEKAEGELIALGMAVVPPLRQTANTSDEGESAARARHCLEFIEGPRAVNLAVAAAHQVAALKPEGAAEALLAFLPFADNDRVTEEVEAALVEVGVRSGKPDPAITKALEDKVPIRRTAAAKVLCSMGPSQHATVRPLLKDPKPTVRLHVALSLAESNDVEAVPVLIGLLADLAPEQRKQAEEFLTGLAGEWAVVVPQGNDATSRRVRREAWLGWWRSMDGPALLEEFKKRTLSDEAREHAAGLIAKLGAESAEEREKASAELVGMGPEVAPLLRRAAGQGDASVAPLAEKCLRLIEKDLPTPLPGAATRLISLRRPEGAAEALLAYLPFAESEEMEGQVREALAAVGFRDGKADPALARALEDKVPVRRGAAAEALCRGGPGEHLAAIRKLLKDADAGVRLQAALALAGAQEKEAVPVLIALLGELPLDKAHAAEDYLARVAGDKAPSVPLGTDEASRTKAREAWTAWWKDNADKVVLVRPDQTRGLLGLTLIVENFNPAKGNGRVVELDAAGKVRWEIAGLMGPLDAEVVPGGKVLIVEANMNRVSERDLKGKVLWEKTLPQPFTVQRLRNGHTFVACRNQLIEFDRDGKQVFQVNRPTEYLMSARKLRDGGIALINNQGLYHRLDASGKEVKSFRIPNTNFGIGNVEVLPNDHVLSAVPNLSKVMEYNAEGKTVWETSIPFPGMPTRMSNGHVVVVSNNLQQITELDRNGKIVSEMKDPAYRPYRVYRR